MCSHVNGKASANLTGNKIARKACLLPHTSHVLLACCLLLLFFFIYVNFSTTRSRSTASWLQWNKLREFWGRTLVVWFDLHFIKRGLLILQYSIMNIQNLIGFSDIFKITNIQTTSYMCLTFSAFLITGFSDPYCLLSILHEDKDSHGAGSSNKPQKAVVRDSAKGQVLETTIKKQTLNPIWNETFKLWVRKTFIESIWPAVDGWFCLNAWRLFYREFEDISNANFHIEMWWVKRLF